MKLYLKTRTHEIEQTEQFLVWKTGSDGRKDAAASGVRTKIENMNQGMRTVEITIVRGKTRAEIRDLAAATHGGNYAGDPGEFYFDDRVARNCIRHNLTNYEELWSLCNRGDTGREAYKILRERVERLIDEAYPEFRMTTAC